MQNKSFVAGIDVGGLTTEIGLVNEEGICSNKKTIITKEFNDVNDFIIKCLELINELQDEYVENIEIKAIGIGAPNANFYKGTIEHPVNLKWKGIIPFVKIFNQHTRLPVSLTNDANAAAIGEKVYGGAKNMENFLSITLGTGLGSGIYTNGKLLHGHQGFAGEMGQVIIKDNGRICGSGKRGCLEAYASVLGIRRTIFYLLSDLIQESVFRDIPFNQVTANKLQKQQSMEMKLP